MHELSITENLVRILQEQGTSQNFSKVLKVHLEIGALSTIEPDSIVFCFDIIAKETIAEGAVIEISRVPAVAKCRICHAQCEITAYGESCNSCGSIDLEVLSGKDMIVKNVEVDG